MKKIDKSCLLLQPLASVWALLSAPDHLALFHPFCLRNKALIWEPQLPKHDILQYYSGLRYERHFLEWCDLESFSLQIGKKDGRQSVVTWKLKAIDQYTRLTIEIVPYRTHKVPSMLYPIFYYLVLRPVLKKYLSHVLSGLQFYMEHGKPVVKNQFGQHAWFS